MDDRVKWAIVAGVLLLMAKKGMGVNVKPGAVLPVTAEMNYAVQIVSQVWSGHGMTPTITSGTDGEHKDDSLHYSGLALDFRTKNVFDPIVKRSMIQEVRARLGSNYDVILESEGLPNEHLHVEFDPK